jgi:hypothetical protein
MTGNLMKSPPERNIELLRRGSGLFWPGEGLTEEADTWPE